MASRGTIHDLFDIANIEAQKAKVVSIMDDYVSAVAKANKAKIGAGSGKPSEQIAGIEGVTAAHKKQVKVLTEFQQIQTKIAKLRNGEFAQLQAAKDTLKDVNKELAMEAKLRNAVSGSLEEARAKVALMRYELEKLNLTTAAGKARQAELIAGLDQQNKFIDVNSDALARQKINVGNYAGSLGVLARSLKGLGGLGERVASALGVDPATAGIIRQAGLALNEYRHATEGSRLATGLSTAATTEHTAVTARDGVTTLSTAAATVEAEVATKDATVAQRIYNFVVGESVGVMKVLRIAMASTGVLLLVAGIVALVSHLSSLAKQSEITKATIDDLKYSLDRLGKSTEDTIDRLKFNQDLLIEKMKQRGATEAEIAEQEKNNLREVAKLERANAENSIKIIEKKTGINLDSINTLKAAEDALNKLRDKKQQNDLVIAQGSGGMLDATGNLLVKQAKAQKDIIEGAIVLGEKVVESFKKATKADQQADVEAAQFKSKQAEDARQKAKKDAKEAQDLAEKIAEADRKATFEIEKQKLDFIIEINNKIAGDNEKHIAERSAAALVAFEAEKELILLTSDFEKQTKGLTKKEIILINEKAIIDLQKAELKYYDALEEAQKDFDKVYIEEERKIQEELEKGIAKSVDEYLKRLNKEKELREKTAKDIIDSEKKIAQDKKKIYKELYDEISKTVVEFFTAQQDRNIANLQKEADALDIRKARDIDIVNQTVTNKQEAAAQIAIIEAKAQTEHEAINRRQKEEERKKATIEKLGKAAEIVGNTASGIVSLSIKAAEARAQAAVLASNPITLPFAAFATAMSATILAQIPFVIAIGAAQLARLVIPKYKKGGTHPGGLGEVGHGKPEGIVLPDGTVLRSPATPTLLDMPKGTVIYPDFDKMILAATMTRPVEYGGRSQSDSSVKVVAGLKAVERAIGKIPQTTVEVANPLRQRIRYGHSINEHLTRNLGK